MECKHRVVPPEVLMEQLPSLLEETKQFPLVVSGASMTPFLAPGRDTVFLSKLSRPLRRGDMVLFRRSSGRYVLHRILRVGRDGLSLIGDAQTIVETGIDPTQVLAIVTAVRRKGELLKQGDFLWEFFRVVWLRIVPLRHAVWKLYAALHRHAA